MRVRLRLFTIRTEVGQHAEAVWSVLLTELDGQGARPLHVLHPELLLGLVLLGDDEQLYGQPIQTVAENQEVLLVMPDVSRRSAGDDLTEDAISS